MTRQRKGRMVREWRVESGVGVPRGPLSPAGGIAGDRFRSLALLSKAQDKAWMSPRSDVANTRPCGKV